MKVPITIYAESTPNPNAMKYVASTMLIDGAALDFPNRKTTLNAPLAMELFNFPFVAGVFLSSNFITISKNETVDWEDVNSELRNFLFDYLSNNKPVLNGKVATEKAVVINSLDDSNTALLPTSELDIKISQILDEYIKPAVEGDGGAITFKSFQKGIVTVVLQGSCSGCPSSTVTLKAGIEALLKRMVPEVTAVVAHEE